MSLFNVEWSARAGGGITFSLSGELDLSTVEQFERAVSANVDGNPEFVVLDLRELAFLDSAGLRIMLQLQEKVAATGGRLTLVKGSRRVHRVFELTGADDELEIVADPSEISQRPDLSAGKG